MNFALLRRGSKPVWKPRSMQTLGWWVSSLFPWLSPLNRESLGKRLVSVISVYWNSSCLWILILMLGLYIVSETDPLPQKKKTHFSSFVEVGLACETCLYTWPFEMESKFIFLLNSKGAIYKLYSFSKNNILTLRMRGVNCSLVSQTWMQAYIAFCTH